jgi:hypothetical protein
VRDKSEAEESKGLWSSLTDDHSDDEKDHSDADSNATDDLDESLKLLLHESLWLLSLSCVHCDDSNRCLVACSDHHPFADSLCTIGTEEGDVAMVRERAEGNEGEVTEEEETVCDEEPRRS